MGRPEAGRERCSRFPTPTLFSLPPLLHHSLHVVGLRGRVTLLSLHSLRVTRSPPHLNEGNGMREVSDGGMGVKREVRHAPWARGGLAASLTTPTHPSHHPCEWRIPHSTRYMGRHEGDGTPQASRPVTTHYAPCMPLGRGRREWDEPAAMRRPLVGKARHSPSPSSRILSLHVTSPGGRLPRWGYGWAALCAGAVGASPPVPPPETPPLEKIPREGEFTLRTDP